MATSTTWEERSKIWVGPSKNYKSSARLHLQHFLVQNTLGYLIEPTIENTLADTQPLKIADLACGNGIWLTEVHSHLAKNNIETQLNGFDIHPLNFPHPIYLPTTVSLKQLDIFATPLPAELLGVYDVIHIRFIVSLVPGTDVTPVLSLVSKLLKPGGYLQWDEVRADTWFVEAPPQISQGTCDAIVHKIKEGMAVKGISHEWVDALSIHLESFGYQDVQQRREVIRRQDFKAWTEDYLMVFEESTARHPSKSESPDAPMTAEAWTELVAAAVKETEEGVVIHQGAIVTVIGRKAI